MSIAKLKAKLHDFHIHLANNNLHGQYTIISHESKWRKKVFSGVRVAQSLVFVVVFACHCLSFFCHCIVCPCHCIVCPFFVIVLYVLRCTVSIYPFVVFKSLTVNVNVETIWIIEKLAWTIKKCCFLWIHKINDTFWWTLQKNGVEVMCSGRVCSSWHLPYYC